MAVDELKTTRITCDHCGTFRDVPHLTPIEFGDKNEKHYGFYLYNAGEYCTSDGANYHFTFHFCSHECMGHAKFIKAKRIEAIYRARFEREKIN